MTWHFPSTKNSQTINKPSSGGYPNPNYHSPVRNLHDWWFRYIRVISTHVLYIFTYIPMSMHSQDCSWDPIAKREKLGKRRGEIAISLFFWCYPMVFNSICSSLSPYPPMIVGKSPQVHFPSTMAPRNGGCAAEAGAMWGNTCRWGPT